MAIERYGPRTPAWQKLKAAKSRMRSLTVDSLFETDEHRFSSMSVESCGLLLDFSRQLLDPEALSVLIDLAEQTQVRNWIERMFAAEHINNTEDRPALHVALRQSGDKPFFVNGRNVVPDVSAELTKMRVLAEALEAGQMKGHTGRVITDIVNIGIGGSDLGIAMVVEALAQFRRPDLAVHFVSNVDGVDLEHVLSSVDPETTLFVICSKSFTTLETLTNAQGVREWLLDYGGLDAIAAQCVAVSTNQAAMDNFGIAADKRLEMWDWVGGRFSLWSAVGLTIALSVGWDNFRAMLNGAHDLDEHFRDEPIESNMPALLALVGIWNRNFLGAGSHAVLPYDDHLARLPAFLQQLEMESNGKSVRRGGAPVECDTCPVVWGEPGSNAQHSFYQLLHQGTEAVSIDFLLPKQSGVGRQRQHDLAVANCLAQTWALASGDPAGAADSAHQRYPGSRGSTLVLFEQLDPPTLGKLVALYEHKVFTQGVIWDVNSFDQYGVELGKRLAQTLLSSADKPPMPIAGSMRWLQGAD